MPTDTSNKKSRKKNKPCIRCKTQRRKCDRAADTDECLRCLRSNRQCVNDDSSLDLYDDCDCVDGDVDLQQLATYVASLQENLQQMESQLHHERHAMANHIEYNKTTKGHLNGSASIPSSLCDSTPLQNMAHSLYVTHDPQSSSMQLLPITPVSSNGCIISKESTTTNDEKEYQWDLTLVNGKLRLESTIRAFDELMAYGQALQRYLSPFAGVFENTSFLFETIQPQSLVPMVIQVVSQSPGLRYGNSTKSNSTSMITKYHFVLKRHHPAVLLAAEGKPPPISCFDELLQIYFTCFNPAMPLIHAPSYLAEYETVIRANPTQHALTLSICSMVCCSTCKHLLYDNYEKRILADYFYEKTVDLLGDFFDDPDRRLETIMVITLLSQYLQMTLRVGEARKWCTIAFMIAQELLPEYNLHRQTSSSPSSSSLSSSPSSTATDTATYTTIDPSTPQLSSNESIYSLDSTPTTKDKNIALFSRHYVITLFSQRFLSLILDQNPYPWDFLDSQPLLYLEDECELTYTFIGVYNKVLEIVCHPVLLELREQIHRMQLGEKAELTLELILRVDQIHQEWWKSLPSQFRICDQDPSNASSRQAIEQCTSQIQLIVVVIALCNKAEAHLALTKPSNQSVISQGGNYELVRAIQERALNEAYECSESLIVAFRNLESRKNYCIFSSELLIGLSDILCTLAGSSSLEVKRRAKLKLTDSLRDLRRAKFMEGNLVPPSLSPLAFMDTSKSVPVSSDELPQNIIEMYNEYTSPCLAFGYDILRKASLDD